MLLLDGHDLKQNAALAGQVHIICNHRKQYQLEARTTQHELRNVLYKHPAGHPSLCLRTQHNTLFTCLPTLHHSDNSETTSVMNASPSKDLPSGLRTLELLQS